MKNSTKKNGNVKIYTKEELLEMMNKNLNHQIKMAEELKVMYENVKDCANAEDRKARNSLQTQLNAQYDAIGRSCSSIIKINNSKLDNELDEEIEEEDMSIAKVRKKELVD